MLPAAPTDPMSFSRENPSPRFKALQALYRQMHAEGARHHGLPPEKTFPGKSLYAHVKPIRQLILATGARSILDYGAGKGLQYKPQKVKVDGTYVADGIAEYWDVDEVRCYDPGHAPFAQLPKGSFDGVICTDVLEHCAEEDLPWIVAELFGYARRFVYANVACFAARKMLPNGDNAHVTVRPPQWWRDLFETCAAAHPALTWELGTVAVLDGRNVEAVHRGGPPPGETPAGSTSPQPAAVVEPARLRLNVGCGDKLLAGYVNVDVAPSRLGARPDVLCDIRDLKPFADASADEILSVHALEHFVPWEAEGLLREWMRVLRPGGVLAVECPNIAYACEQLAGHPEIASRYWLESESMMWVLYGDPKWRDPLMSHRWGYTPASLAELMRRVGLENVRQEAAQYKRREPRDMRVVGERPARAGNDAIRPPAREPLRAARPDPVPPGDAYLKWYYDSGVWKGVSYRGVRTLKMVTDLWNYQEIFAEKKIEWVLETGTRHGGSALYFADLLANAGAPGVVVTVDVDHRDLQAPPHPRVRTLLGDSASEAVRAEVERIIPRARGAMFLILDADHRRDHVLRELELYVPMLLPGDYLVVEDTCVNGHPVRPDFGPGPWEAVGEFLERHPATLRWDRERESKFGATFAPRGHFVRL